jgi:hypothetical protein
MTKCSEFGGRKINAFIFLLQTKNEEMGKKEEYD